MAKKNFLYERVYNKIYHQIVSGDYKPGDLLPTEKELCEKMQVSLITVRRALKELEDEGLVKKVRGKGTYVNEDISVHKNTSSANNSIGVLFIPYKEITNSDYPKRYDYEGDWQNSIYSSMFEELSDDFNIIIDGYPVEDLINDFERTVFSRTDRILVLGEYTSELIDFLHDKEKLVIVYNNFDSDLKVASVNNNEKEICRKAVEYLIEKGHTKIGAINGITGFSESIERYVGFQEAIIYNNLSINTDFIKWGNMAAESGYYLMKEMIKGDNYPSAVFCVNDGVAMGALDAIKEDGLNCPQDISLISHDNSEEGKDLDPQLTTIDPKYTEVGKEIAKRMKRDIWIDDVTYVESELVIRDSVKQLNND